MNGYQLTQKLKNKRKEISLSATDQALYHELVSICNENRWKKIFYVRGVELCAALQISIRTLNRCRKNLASAGLISYHVNNNRRMGCSYSFENIPQDTEAYEDLSAANIAPEAEIPPYNINIKTIKQEKYIYPDMKNNLRLPYSSEEFLRVWNILRNTPKWKNKTDYALQVSLDKLARYSEEFAIYQMNRAIESGWTGVVFIPGTDREYEEWKQLKQNTDEKNRKLSKADKERLLLEEYAAILSGTQRYLPDEEVLKF